MYLGGVGCVLIDLGALVDPGLMDRRSWGLCSEMLDLSVRRVCPVGGPVRLMVCVGHCPAPFTSG